jgi:hypothetical protein
MVHTSASRQCDIAPAVDRQADEDRCGAIRSILSPKNGTRQRPSGCCPFVTMVAEDQHVTKCNFPRCENEAIGGFIEIDDVSSLTQTGNISHSETYWCRQHEQSLSEHFYGKSGEWVTLESSDS